MIKSKTSHYVPLGKHWFSPWNAAMGAIFPQPLPY